jgi:hypothetical protein
LEEPKQKSQQKLACRNSGLSVERCVKDLLSCMTLKDEHLAFYNAGMR